MKRRERRMKRQDLKRGMRCTERSGLQYIIDEVEADKITFIYSVGDDYSGVYYINEDLTSGTIYDDADIMKVEDITEDGYEVIWEREEDKYYLRLPKDFIGAELSDAVYLNLGKSDKKYFFDVKSENSIFQTQFTQEEIDKLDITHLVKEAVE